MEGNKKTYYISISNGEIFQDREASPWNFKIEANDEEIMQLREYFDHNYTVGEKNFLRAHIPFVEYHNDEENDEQDHILQEVYGMIYELGDAEAKQFIKSIGVLEKKERDDGLIL